ncbi:MAG: hypothetical protein KJ710_03585 [Candidatus Omnitrophica bacterium]|nr:hypothetical protein [Candidatus Omnitrophota bacterium]MBU1923333.1 hypothetical protein [Candidatus Omnitrophota bacterium]
MLKINKKPEARSSKKAINKLRLIVLIIVSLFYLFGMSIKNSLAEQEELIFENGLRYDIYFVLEDQMQYIANVKIIDRVKIEGVIFLAIQYPGITSGKTGYVSLSKIRVILPAGAPKPQNVSNK